MALELKKINLIEKSGMDKFIAAWGYERLIPATLQKYNGDMEEFAAYLETMEKDPPRLLVNSTMWFLTEGEEILGVVELRHLLNSGLARYGGHVGYGVAPCHRGHGYAARMVDMIKEDAKKLGISRLMICCLAENTASAKTILNAGGVLGDEVEIFRDGAMKTGQRYWLDL